MFGTSGVRGPVGETVAVPVDASRVVDDVVTDAGGSVVRTKVGDVHVAERPAEADVVFGGEPSGAWIWPDRTRCPDGHHAACRVAAMADEPPLAPRVADLPTYPIESDAVAVDGDDPVEELIDPIESLVRETDGEVTTVDGLRVAVGDG